MKNGNTKSAQELFTCRLEHSNIEAAEKSRPAFASTTKSYPDYDIYFQHSIIVIVDFIKNIWR
ncbi:hypothetical protein LJC56_06270 [Christensenellaceae bacterium OttesenSCG-928-K19]|nr:hypothetical protein [Christensenellaceae bacterium OttesenSCG-928-K19]